MTARIIWIGKNSQMAVTPRSASSAGATAAARPSLLPDDGRAAPSLQPRNSSPRRGTLARSHIGNAAPLFDATEGQWIVPPSTIMVDAGAAADLRHAKTTHTHTAETRRRARRSPLARHLILELLEFFVVTIGMGASVILAVLLWAVMA